VRLPLISHCPHCAFIIPPCADSLPVRYAAGDLIAQSFENDGEEASSVSKKGYNWERAAVFMAFGTFLAGPV
jgi:hypothetical protein